MLHEYQYHISKLHIVKNNIALYNMVHCLIDNILLTMQECVMEIYVYIDILL